MQLLDSNAVTAEALRIALDQLAESRSLGREKQTKRVRDLYRQITARYRQNGESDVSALRTTLRDVLMPTIQGHAAGMIMAILPTAEDASEAQAVPLLRMVHPSVGLKASNKCTARFEAGTRVWHVRMPIDHE